MPFESKEEVEDTAVMFLRDTIVKMEALRRLHMLGPVLEGHRRSLFGGWQKPLDCAEARTESKLKELRRHISFIIY